MDSDREQMSLLQLWPCNACGGRGRVREGWEGDWTDKPCPTCRGSGTLDYDPEDKSQIPF